MYHGLFIYSFVDGHPSFIQFGAIMKKPAMDIYMYLSMDLCFQPLV